MNKREELLNAAQNAVAQTREAEYGPPQVNLQCTADLWSTYLNHIWPEKRPLVLDSHDVAMLNVLQKVSRIACGPAGDDTYTDIAGYAALAGELK